MARSPRLQSVTKWNWRVHVYLGLYMLLFLWLFSISGLILNHPGWFPHRPQRTRSEHPVRLPETSDMQKKAESLAKQLGLEGETITNRQPPGQDRFLFRVARPGRIWTVSVDGKTSVATVMTARGDTSSLLEMMHTFTGVRPVWGEPASRRDWWVTGVWSFALDAVSVGLLLQVASSWYMWYQLRDKRRAGLVVFASGLASCAFFLWGLAWIP